MNRSFLAVVATGAVLAGTTACESTPVASHDSAVIRVLLTDAPADYLEEAWVEISRIYLIPGAEEANGELEAGPPFVELFNDPDAPLSYDLLTLRDGVTAELTGNVEIPAGRYNQLRMVVSGAWVTLREPWEFRDGSGRTRELFVPSGAQSGIKVNLKGAIDAEAGTVNEILVDVDVDRNFVIQGNPHSPAGIHRVLFTPMLQELTRNVEEG